jgi:SAM-dependent methyltransferase
MDRKHLHSNFAQVQTIIDKHVERLMAEMKGDEELQVLEAGCGSSTQFFLPEKTHLFGIDNSPEQLERNKFIRTKILGDIEQYDMPASAYDIVLCYDVIEHLQHPEPALRHMARALRPGGILIVCAPARESFKGVITRFTPHWFHVWVYKHLLRDQWAGQPGRHPFRAYLKKEMGRNWIARYARKQGLEVEYNEAYGHNPIFDRFKKTSLALYHFSVASGKLVKLLTFGAVKPEITDVSIVLRRPYEFPASSFAFEQSSAPSVAVRNDGAVPA